MSTDTYVIPPPPQAALAVAGSTKTFPVRRIWCVGRNYLEHIREMGNDEREPPFFFASPPTRSCRTAAPCHIRR
jgi:fumarylpyruvate hydrolase